jgi:hypothetical protein
MRQYNLRECPLEIHKYMGRRKGQQQLTRKVSVLRQETDLEYL